MRSGSVIRPEMFSWILEGQVAFGLVAGGWHARVGGEAEEVVLAVAEGFQQ